MFESAAISPSELIINFRNKAFRIADSLNEGVAQTSHGKDFDAWMFHNVEIRYFFGVFKSRNRSTPLDRITLSDN